MHIKTLRILKNGIDGEEINRIDFKIGLNIIADKSVNLDKANAVGKTTVLKLIDICLGEDVKKVFTDTENSKNINEEVKAFLLDNQVVIELTLTEDLDNPSGQDIIIERNFDTEKNKIRRINATPITSAEDFRRNRLPQAVFGIELGKPSFRQLIAHSIRYKNERIENCLKYLGIPSGENKRYEALYLYMFLGKRAETLLNPTVTESGKEMKASEALLGSFLEGQSLEQLSSELTIVKNRISKMEEKKKLFAIDDNYEQEINILHLLNEELLKGQQIVESLRHRKQLLTTTIEDLENSKFTDEQEKLKLLYQEYLSLEVFSEAPKKFETLVSYHNDMNKNRIRFLEEEIPKLDARLNSEESSVKQILAEIREIESKFKATVTFEEFERLTININGEYESKGELEGRISKAEKIKGEINSLHESLKQEELYKEQTKKEINDVIEDFNINFFSKISRELYDEDYYIVLEKREDKNKVPFYSFEAKNRAFSSGDKQGESLCFDIAYSIFAQKNNIPHLKFIANDKKELLDLNKIGEAKKIAEENNIQLIFSLLSDKLASMPSLVNDIRLELSEKEKLFRF